MVEIDFAWVTNYLPLKKILTNQLTKKKNKFKKINSKKLYEKNDPINIIETYVHFKNWIMKFSDSYRNLLIPTLLPFAILILFDLLKKNFLVEAKFFSITFISDLGETHKILFGSIKNLIINRKSQIKEFFNNKSKIFHIELPANIFTKLIFFFEENFYLHFLKYINKYFKVKFLFKITNLIDKSKFSYERLSVKKNSIQVISKNTLELNKNKYPIKNIKSYNYVERKLKFYKTLKIFSKNLNVINSVSISSDENTIVSGLEDSSIRVFDFINNSNKNQTYSLISHSASISCVKISTCNNFFISSSVDGELNLWSLEYKKKLLNFENFNKPVWDISFSSKENLFSTACGDSLATLWVIDRLFPVRFFIGHKSDINVTRWHPSNSIIATGSDDNIVRLWDIKSAKSIYSYSNFNNNVYNIEFSSDGLEMCISGLTNYIDIWDLRTGKTLKRIKDKNCQKNIKNMTYSPDGSFLVHDSNSKTINFINRKNYNWYNFKPNIKKNTDAQYSLSLDFKKIFQIKFNSSEKITIIGI
jgi:WD40 repeat protein